MGVFQLNMNFSSRGASNVLNNAFGKYVDTYFIFHSTAHVWYVARTWKKKMLRQPCDVTDVKRFASVPIPIYFILVQFKRNRIRDSHTICFGYLKIGPLNFPNRLDCNEVGFLIYYIYCPTVILCELFLSARAVCVLWWCFIVRYCSSPNDWLFKT